ncbi:hypothetical protein HN992_00505 [Candidatus Woesearchaeota archaeon]|jgi:hypothetical protein|nr:hypothetical protein [Candidatus Woesearchaeota archaeon]MBT4783674.1 hypothetical protein [Candidatus Woesearchaeota archaeon]MBT6940916.1 hypothetical protein [Candidatus Woesearchaeota archaeon]MBT7148508.1 hypothetical protein [Candidatus Woesearchaeota archaeon]
MQEQTTIPELKRKYPHFSELELHFFNMKYCGIQDPKIALENSRPIFELWDENQLVELDFLISENSPYKIKEDKIHYHGNELNLNHLLLDRIKLSVPHIYVRGPLGGTKSCPTLDGFNSMNINPRQLCKGCDFCAYSEKNDSKRNRNIEDVLNEAETSYGLKNFDQLAFVTGCFKNEAETTEKFRELIRNSRDKGFEGRYLYIGSQITDEYHLEAVAEEMGGFSYLDYVYTIERFSNREEIMHNSKGKPKIKEIIQQLSHFSDLEFNSLQYSYLVGIENLNHLKKNAINLVPYATPHISIFRKSNSTSDCFSKDYLNLGAEFSCNVRDHFEEIYGTKILGNNLANLWPFPRERVKWFTQNFEEMYDEKE